MRSRHLAGAALAALAAVMSLAITAGPAGASAPDDEQALAERFAPVVRLVHQDEECGPGEPYRPSDVETVLGDRSVALRGPWDGDEVVEVGPTAEDLGQGLSGYYLDFPGNPLDAGCDYERWSRVTAADSAPTTYAHVVTEDGHDDRVVLQYWFFYPFNDYTNKHEGDWEVIQLVFAAPDATEALDQTPIQVGYSQHEGLELSSWDDPKLEIVEGTHPVVYPAAGSHANFYESALYLGTSAEQGFGCDDTRGPSDDVRPAVAVVPADPEAAVADFPWLAYQGRWGQREASFYNGPTGPNTKASWTRPVTDLAQKGRDLSYAVPAAGLLGTSATDFFCSTVASGSEVVRKLADHPLRLLLIAALLAALAIYLLHRTTWTPDAPLRLARRRATGQVIRAAGRMYASRWRMFIGIGFLTLPVSVVVFGLQSLILGAPDVEPLSRGGEGGGYRVALSVLVGVPPARDDHPAGAGCHHPCPPRDRPRRRRRRAARVPTGPGPLAAVARSLLDRRDPAGAPQRDRRAVARRGGADPAVRALRAGHHLRGRRRDRVAAPQRHARHAAGHQDRRPAGDLDPGGRRAGAAARHAPHPGHRCAVPGGQRRGRCHLRRADAVRRAHDGLPLLRRSRPLRAGPRRTRRLRGAAGRDRAPNRSPEVSPPP